MILKEMIASSVSQRELAGLLGISTAAVNALINRGLWPAKDAGGVQARLARILMERFSMDSRAALNILPPIQHARDAGKDIPPMIMRKQTLLPAAKRFFNVRADVFGEDVRSTEDLYFSDHIRYVREALYSTAKHGGMLAVVGDSGSGKSTLKDDLIDRIRREDTPVTVIEPYVLGMEENDSAGKTMKAMHIAEAILCTVAPDMKRRGSPEARFRQVHKVLRDSAQAGNQHVLVIEEAHCMPRVTLKHLKRFAELKDGFRRLLGIIILGQTELETRLSATEAEVREVVQRIEMVHLGPLQEPQEYVTHRLRRAGLDFDKVFTSDAMDALVLKHAGEVNRKTGVAESRLFPLAVGNTLTAAMNLAAYVGEPKITGEIIRKV